VGRGVEEDGRQVRLTTSAASVSRFSRIVVFNLRYVKTSWGGECKFGKKNRDKHLIIRERFRVSNRRTGSKDISSH
jgi:hypothetical protein